MVLGADVREWIAGGLAPQSTDVIIHTAFDLLAVVTLPRSFFLPLPQSSVGQPWRLHPSYVSFAALGMMAGALAAGTANLFLSGLSEIGKSVLGGLAGAILAVEILKRRLGIRVSTGLRFAAPLTAAIAVGPPSSPLCAKGSMTARSAMSCATRRSGATCAGSISSRCRTPGATRVSCPDRTALCQARSAARSSTSAAPTAIGTRQIGGDVTDALCARLPRCGFCDLWRVCPGYLGEPGGSR